MRNHPNQFDDEVVATGPHYEALIDGFVIHEMIENKDIVVWYGAHFTHLHMKLIVMQLAILWVPIWYR